MLEFAIANLVTNETSFVIPGKLGNWQFVCTHNYQQIVTSLDQGMCGNTFFASIDTITPRSSDSDFQTACDEIIDICLISIFKVQTTGFSRLALAMTMDI